MHRMMRHSKDPIAKAILTESSKSPASIAKSNKQWVGTGLYQEECKLLLINCGAVIRLWASSEADCEYPFDYNKKTKNPVRKLDIRYLHFTAVSSRSLPPPIKAGRFPFAQNLVKLSRSLNRFPWQDSLFSLFTALKSANAHDFTLCCITME